MAESIISPRRSSSTTTEVPFKEFWSRSRYRTCIKGMDPGDLVKQYFEDIKNEGGFFTFLECVEDGKISGSLVVYKDPWYRSFQRDDVACFGLVTVSRANIFKVLLNRARQEIEKHGFSTMRGPVNSPRTLFGYGVQSRGYEWPVISGSSADPPRYARIYSALDAEHHFDKIDKYYNLLQDFGKTRAYISSINLNRNFQIINPNFDDDKGITQDVADMLNRNLDYRPDYQATSAERLLNAARMYKLVPGAEKLVGLFYDGSKLGGVVIMQPDWFQVLTGRPLTTIIGDVYLLDKEYQGSHLFMYLSEYSMLVLKDLGIARLEATSIWEHQEAIKSSLKNGYTKLIKEYCMYELHA